MKLRLSWNISWRFLRCRPCVVGGPGFLPERTAARGGRHSTDVRSRRKAIRQPNPCMLDRKPEQDGARKGIRENGPVDRDQQSRGARGRRSGRISRRQFQPCNRWGEVAARLRTGQPVPANEPQANGNLSGSGLEDDWKHDHKDYQHHPEMRMDSPSWAATTFGGVSSQRAR